MFDGLLRPAPEVFTGAPDVFAKVFAAAQYATMPHVMAHAFAGFFTSEPLSFIWPPEVLLFS